MRPGDGTLFGSGDPVRSDAVRALAQETGLSDLTVRVCMNRGLHCAQEIEEFLTPRFEGLTSPMRILDMDIALARLTTARASGETVWIFGDYDVDGTTGAYF